MEAAFVEIGLEKNGFLYVDEIVGPEIEKAPRRRKIQDLIKRGETILVQAVKDPMKTKGARLTTADLAARPLRRASCRRAKASASRAGSRTTSATGSRTSSSELDVKEGGVIVRTAAEGASEEDIERDLDFLQRLWKSIEAKAKTGDTRPSSIYQEAELPLRVVARPLHRRLREALHRRRPHAQAHRRLPEEDLAAHGRARHPLPARRRR